MGAATRRGRDTIGTRRGSAGGAEELLALRIARPKERADAARNRAAVLDAAERLFAEQGIETVTMDAVATAAGVGKGTLFRRFGNKAGLAVALLDERERALQEAVLFGPSPLGPGRDADLPSPSPGARLRAFVEAYLRFAFANLELVRMSETASPAARYRVGAYRFWHRHVAIVLADARPGCDAEADAHGVLAPLSGEHLSVVVGELGAERVRLSALALLDALLTAPDRRDPSDRRDPDGRRG